MIMNKPAILFDLDGTLVDSSADIIDSLHCAYKSVGYEEKIEIPHSLLGPPVSEMIKRLTPHLDPKFCDAINAKFREIYDHSLYPGTFLYEGALNLLANCSQRGNKMFVVTNKMKLATVRILTILKIKSFFSDIITPDHIRGRKMNKEKMVDYAIKKNSLVKINTIMIGDSASDIEAAHLNGINAIGFSGGFGNVVELSNAKPTYVTKTFEDINRILSYMCK
jgi:phosphoglycolate phosphatase